MQYRELGRTGWNVSTISFGAWAIGASWGSVNDAESLAALPDGPAKADGMAVGRAAAAAIIADRTDDGSSPPQFYTPAGDAPYAWQPTPSCANAPANNRGSFLHWQFVKPFGIRSSAQFRAPRPPALVSARYTRDFEEVKALGDAASTIRPPDRADVARVRPTAAHPTASRG